jgi:proline iminopeptidase
VPFCYADGALHPVTTRKAVAESGKPLLLLAGEYDVGLPPRDAAGYAGLFEHAE